MFSVAVFLSVETATVEKEVDLTSNSSNGSIFLIPTLPVGVIAN